jgi:acetylornithine deacetylase/succinyl-diaminopimelate desuccinylase-like protein
MRAVLCALILLWPLLSHTATLREAVTEQAQRNFPEMLELLSLPNVADRPADIQRNARFLESAFSRRGFKTRLIDNPAARPAVYAELAGGPGAKAVLFYSHFDGQPVRPELWSQKDPFQPVVKERRDGSWHEVPRERLFARPLDHELRVFARSASDDKAPIMMLLTAIDVMKARGDKPAITIKVLLDPEEEMGSPSLAGMVERHRELFDAEALVILDGPAHSSGRPTLVFGNRGIAQATLTVYGPRHALHSGHYGNYAPNPAFRLAHLLASMKAEDGRVLIPDYYACVKLTDSDRKELAAVPDDEGALLKRIGVSRAERVGGNYQEALQYPSLNVRGMSSAATGEKTTNIVPSEAVAEIDVRTTPECDGRRQFELIRRHIEQQGYELVEGPPSDEERARHDKLATFTLHSVQAAMRMPMDAPVGAWARAALGSRTANDQPVDPVSIRMMGGTVPVDVLVRALDLPFLTVPTVNSDNNQHASDENLRIGHFISGTETVVSLLSTRYP